MMFVYFAFLLLVTPVEAHPQSASRELWGWTDAKNAAKEKLHSFKQKVRDFVSGKVESSRKMFGRHFPKASEVLDEMSEQCETSFEELKSDGEEFIIDNVNGFWHDATEGLKGKNPFSQLRQLIKNIDDLTDCSLYTWEVSMKTKCNINHDGFKDALLKKFAADHDVKTVSLVVVQPCVDEQQTLEVEFDMQTAETHDKTVVKAEQLKGALETFLESKAVPEAFGEYLDSLSCENCVSNEPSFCEAYESGKDLLEEAAQDFVLSQVTIVTGLEKELLESLVSDTKEERELVAAIGKLYLTIQSGTFDLGAINSVLNETLDVIREHKGKQWTANDKVNERVNELLAGIEANIVKFINLSEHHLVKKAKGIFGLIQRCSSGESFTAMCLIPWRRSEETVVVV